MDKREVLMGKDGSGKENDIRDFFTLKKVLLLLTQTNHIITLFL